MNDHNEYFKEEIMRFIPDISNNDIIFLLRITTNLDNSIENADNFRFCKLVQFNCLSDEYQKAVNKGCCGFFDEEYINPSNGNRFSIGFNFGH